MMMKLYKLTKKDHTTYGGCQWGEGVTRTADGQGTMCTSPTLDLSLPPISQDDIDRQVGKLSRQLQPGMSLRRNHSAWLVYATDDEMGAQILIADDVTPEGALRKAFAASERADNEGKL
jgi:hypothetical protein